MYEIYVGDIRELRVPEQYQNRITTVVTSPIYYKQRDYEHSNQLGHEESPQEYINNLVEVFKLIRDDVLHARGTLWINLGDTFINKELSGIPWRFALAMKQAGFILQQEVIWDKPNAMPGGSTERLQTTHEHLFLFSVAEHYYFDRIAIMEKGATTPTKHKGSVWRIPTANSQDKHFAVMPKELARNCILAASPPLMCEECCCPRTRVFEKIRTPTRPGAKTKIKGKTAKQVGNRDPGRHVTTYTTIGWAKTCKCKAKMVPPIVFDPFTGSGTTGVVALENGRHFWGVELNRGYIPMIHKNLSKAQTYQQLRLISPEDM